MLAIILGVVAFFALIFIACMVIANKNYAEEDEKAKMEYEKQLSERISLYGNPSLVVKLSKYDYYEIYNECKVICLSHGGNGYRFNFSDIIRAELFDIGSESTTNGNIKSNTGSVVGRAVAGGILAGGVGAVIGGVTGSKENNSTTNTTNYHLLSILLNDIINPEVCINEKDLMFTKENGTIYPIVVSEEPFKYMRELFYRIDMIARSKKI